MKINLVMLPLIGSWHNSFFFFFLVSFSKKIESNIWVISKSLPVVLNKLGQHVHTVVFNDLGQLVSI